MLWFAQAQFVEQCVFYYFDTFQQSHAINIAKGKEMKSGQKQRF